MGVVNEFIDTELSPKLLGLLVVIKANPGISKSRCYPILDSRWRICSTTSADWWIHRMLRAEYIVNRETNGISNLFITEKGEQLLRLVMDVFNGINNCEHTWDECLNQAKNAMAKKVR